jgi:hypothetical protein
LSLEDPIGTLREVAGHGANGNGMTFALGDLVVDLADVLGLPGRVVAVANDDIGGFDAPTLHSGVLRERPT